MGRKSKYSADFKLIIIHEAETSGITRTSKKTSIDFFYILINYTISSVGWESGRYPKRLVPAMRNSTHVISAWMETG
nr:hypothetical protein [Ligilactobacillus ruminis]